MKSIRPKVVVCEINQDDVDDVDDMDDGPKNFEVYSPTEVQLHQLLTRHNNIRNWQKFHTRIKSFLPLNLSGYIPQSKIVRQNMRQNMLYRNIQSIPIEFVDVASESANIRVHWSQWYDNPYSYLFFVNCKTAERYKSYIKKILTDLVEYCVRRNLEFVICYNVPESRFDFISEKLKNDFIDFDVVNSDQIGKLLNYLKEKLLIGFFRRRNRIEQEMKRWIISTKISPKVIETEKGEISNEIHDVCDWFILKESMCFVFEQFSLFRFANIKYSGLKKMFEKSKKREIYYNRPSQYNHISSFMSFEFSHVPRKKQSWKQYRNRIHLAFITELDFIVYIFGRKLRLYFMMKDFNGVIDCTHEFVLKLLKRMEMMMEQKFVPDIPENVFRSQLSKKLKTEVEQEKVYIRTLIYSIMLSLIEEFQFQRDVTEMLSVQTCMKAIAEFSIVAVLQLDSLSKKIFTKFSIFQKKWESELVFDNDNIEEKKEFEEMNQKMNIKRAKEMIKFSTDCCFTKNLLLAMEDERVFLKLYIEILSMAISNCKNSVYRMAYLEYSKELEMVQSGESLLFSSDEIRNSKHHVLQAVKLNGYNLKHASDRLKNDKDVVMQAVKENGDSIKYANVELKNDKEILLIAVEEAGRYLNYASKELKEDVNFVLEAISRNVRSIKVVQNTHQKNINFVAAALLIDVNVWEFLSEENKTQFREYEAKVWSDNMEIKIKNDKDLVACAIRCSLSSLSFASEKLQNDASFINDISKENPRVITYVVNRKILEDLVSRNISLFGLLNDNVIRDGNFWKFLKEFLECRIHERKIDSIRYDEIFLKIIRVFSWDRDYERAIEALSIWRKLYSELIRDGVSEENVDIHDIEFPFSSICKKLHEFAWYNDDELQNYCDPLFRVLYVFITTFSERIDLKEVIPNGKFQMEEGEFEIFRLGVVKFFFNFASKEFDLRIEELVNLSTMGEDIKDMDGLRLFRNIRKQEVLHRWNDKQMSLIFIDPKTGLKNGLGIDFLVSSVKSGVIIRKERSIHNVEFIGRYKKGKREGEGILYDPNLPKSKSCLYHGNFLNDLKDGIGIDYGVVPGMNHYQTIYEGTFKNGKRDGNGLYFDIENGQLIRGFWEAGEMTKTFSAFKFDCWDWKLFFKNTWSIKKEELGNGAFGKILKLPSKCIPSLSELVKGQEFVAVKIFHEKHTSNKKRYEMIFEDIKRSMECLSRVEDVEQKYFCKIFGVIKGEQDGENRIGYVMELAKTSMDLVISKKSDLSLGEKLRILTETARGMKSLHDKKIMHRDLKWQNVLLCEDGQVKITDFDTIREDESSWRSDIDHTTTGRGTAAFYAPERSERTHGLPIDVFSFGIMIYCLLFDEDSPFRTQYSCSCGAVKSKMDPYKLRTCIRKHNFRPLLEQSKVNSILLEHVEYRFLIPLMTLCWEKKPEKRPTFTEIVKIFEEKQCCIFNVIRKVNGTKKEQDEVQPFRVLLMNSSVSELIKSIEERMKGYKVGKMEKSLIGEVLNDENLKKIIEQEEEPKIFVTFSEVPDTPEKEEMIHHDLDKVKELEEIIRKLNKKLKKREIEKEEVEGEEAEEVEEMEGKENLISSLLKKMGEIKNENKELKKLVDFKDIEIEKLQKNNEMKDDENRKLKKLLYELQREKKK